MYFLRNPLTRNKSYGWIELYNEPFVFCGLGYDSHTTLEKSYKIVGYSHHKRHLRIAIYEFATNAWKYIDDDSFYQGCYDDSVSLNGNLYWTSYNHHCILCFDCSVEIFKYFCVLPCKRKNRSCRLHVLGVFKKGRFSLLQQCKGNKKVRIWVAKNKIDDIGEGEVAKWMKFMTVSIPDVNQLFCYTTYFVDETYVKSLVICYSDEFGKAFIYIVKGDVSKRIRLDYKVYKFGQRIITYVPSLLPIRM